MSKEQPIFGIDVHSEYQRGLNFERARAEGYEFCVIKAAEGPYRDGDKYVPTGFKEFFRRAEAEGFVMGVYDFLLSTPAEAQADHFLRTIEAVGGPEDKILMVDFEDYANYPALTPGNDQLKNFIAEVKRRVGDHAIVVYSGRGFWNGGDSSGGFAQYGADVAWDAYYLHMDPVHPKQFYANSKRYFQNAEIPWGWGQPWGGVEPMFWQFTPAGNVAGMNIDVNAYSGTREQLLALTGMKEGGRTGDGGTGYEGAGGGGKRVLTHGVIDGTNFAQGYKYVMQLNNRMKYWVWSSGSVPDGEGAYAVGKPLPPVDQLKGKRIFCLTGDTEVLAKGVERSYKRLYSGEVIAIQTASGSKLTGTPNHPVLTDKGWLPLKALRKGGYVFSSPGFRKAAGPKPHDHKGPTRLEQTHRSLALSGNVERVVGTSLDYHGDGVADGEVEIVLSERELLGGGESALFEQGFEFGFPYPAVAGAGEPAPSSVLDAGFVGSANHGESFPLGQLAVLEPLRLGDAPDGNTGSPETASDSILISAVPPCYGAGHFASEVVSDDSLGVEVETIGRGTTGAVGGPTKPSGFLGGTQFDTGLDEPSTNEAPRYSKPAGNLIGRLTPEIGGNDVLGSNVVAPVFDLGPDAIELRLLALRPELNTSLSEPGFDGPIGRAKLSSNLADGLPPDVCLDKIVSVDVGVFEGHVYNLQTESGTYVANGIVSHNCAGVPNIFRRAAGKIIPTRGDALYDGGIAAYFYTPALADWGLDSP